MSRAIPIENDSQFADGGRVSRKGLRGQFVVAVGAVEEGLSTLAVARQVGMKNQARIWGGLRV